MYKYLPNQYQAILPNKTFYLFANILNSYFKVFVITTLLILSNVAYVYAQAITTNYYYKSSTCVAGSTKLVDVNGYIVVKHFVPPFTGITVTSGNVPTPAITTSGDTIFYNNLRMNKDSNNVFNLYFTDANGKIITSELPDYGNMPPVMPNSENAYYNACDSSITLQTYLSGISNFEILLYNYSTGGYDLTVGPTAVVTNGSVKFMHLAPGSDYRISFMDGCGNLYDNQRLTQSNVKEVIGGRYNCNEATANVGVKMNGTPPFTFVGAYEIIGNFSYFASTYPTSTFFGDSIHISNLRIDKAYRLNYSDGCNQNFSVIVNTPVSALPDDYNDATPYSFDKVTCNNKISLKIKAPSAGIFYNAKGVNFTNPLTIVKVGAYIIIGDIPSNITNPIITYRDSTCHTTRQLLANIAYESIAYAGSNKFVATNNACFMPNHIAIGLGGTAPYTVTLNSGPDAVTYAVVNDSLVLSDLTFWTANGGNVPAQDYNFTVTDACNNTRTIIAPSTSTTSASFLNLSHDVVLTDESGGCSGAGYTNARASFELFAFNNNYTNQVYTIDSIKGAGNPVATITNKINLNIRNLYHDSTYTIYYKDACNNKYKIIYTAQPANTPMVITPSVELKGLCPITTGNNYKLKINTTGVNYPAKYKISGAKLDSFVNVSSNEVVFNAVGNGTYVISITDSCNNIQTLNYTISTSGTITKSLSILSVDFSTCDSVAINVFLEQFGNLSNGTTVVASFKGPYTFNTTFNGINYTRIINDITIVDSKYFTIKIPATNFNLFAFSTLSMNVNYSCGSTSKLQTIPTFNQISKIGCFDGAIKKQINLSFLYNPYAFKFPLKVVPTFSNTTDTATRYIYSIQQFNFAFNAGILDSVTYKVYDACNRQLYQFIIGPSNLYTNFEQETRICGNTSLDRKKSGVTFRFATNRPVATIQATYISGPQSFIPKSSNAYFNPSFSFYSGALVLQNLDTGIYVMQIAYISDCLVRLDTVTVKVEPYLDSLAYTFIPGCLNANKLAGKYYHNGKVGNTPGPANYRLLSRTNFLGARTTTNTVLMSSFANNQDTIFNIPSNINLVVEGGGCSKKDTIIIPPYINPSIGASAGFSCSSGNSIAVLGTNGFKPYSYEILSGTPTNYTVASQASNIFTALPGAVSNVFQVRITDKCANAFTTLVRTDTVVNLITITGNTCVGSTYKAWADSIPNVIYTWVNVSTGATIAGSVLKFNPISITDTGTYKLKMFNTITACTEDTIGIVIIKNCAFELKDSVNQVKCAGQNNASIYITNTGGVLPVTYLWSNGSTTANNLNVTADTYTVTITDANNNTISKSYTITQPTALTAVTTKTDITCYAQNNGAVSVVANGGETPYTYTWSDGSVNITTIANLPKGTYSVEVKDANLCTVGSAKNISEPDALNMNIAAINACNTNGSGQLSILITGGIGSYATTYTNAASTTSNGNLAMANAITANLNNLDSGQYIINAIDANGCTANGNKAVNINKLQANITKTNVLCFGNATGVINVAPSGGEGAYAKAWSNGSTNTNTISNLAANTYSVTITDANNCSIVVIDSITSPTALVLTTTKVNACMGNNLGMITRNITGGAGKYNNLWSNGLATDTIKNLAPGNYSLVVTDTNGCTISAAETILNNTITKNIVATDEDCYAQNNGAIINNNVGSNVPLSYDFGVGFTNINTINNLAAGTYYLVTKDNEGCTRLDTVEIYPAKILVMSTIKTNACNVDGTGKISVRITGGSGTYTTTYSNANFAANSGTIAMIDSVEAVVTSLNTGSYLIETQDAKGCQAVAELLMDINVLESNIAGVNEICLNDSTGAATTLANGGEGAYTYLWSSNSSTSNISKVGTGKYFVTIADVNNCSIIDSITILPGYVLEATSTKTNICPQENNGSISLSITNGIAPYTVNWGGVNTTSLVNNNLPIGEVNITITDNNNCKGYLLDTLTYKYIPTIDTALLVATYDSMIIILDTLLAGVTYNIVSILPASVPIPPSNNTGIFPIDSASAITYNISYDGCTTSNRVMTISIPLNINNIELTAQPLEKSKAALYWKIKNSQDVKSYAVLQSLDGVTFATVKNIDAIAGTNQTVNTTIENLPTSQKVYFKIKSIDINGNYSVSNIANVYVPDEQSITLYPNPTTDKLYVVVSKILGENGSFIIMDALGKIVGKQHKIIPNNTIEIDVQKLPSGCYIICFKTNKTVHNIKFVKQ